MRTEIENNRAFPAILALHLFIVFEAEGPPPSGAKYACGTTQNEQKAGKSQRADHAVRWRSLGYRRRMLVSKFLTSRGRDNAKGKAAANSRRSSFHAAFYPFVSQRFTENDRFNFGAATSKGDSHSSFGRWWTL